MTLCTELIPFSHTLFLLRIGKSGLDLLTSIIVADATTLRWRGLVNGSVPTSLKRLIELPIGLYVYADL